MTDHDRNTERREREAGTSRFSRRSVLSAIGTVAAGLALGSSAGDVAATSPSDSPAADFADETSATTSATSSGSWSDSSVWSDGIPGAEADVRIDAGTSVTLEGETERIKTLVVEGDLSFDPSTDTHLRAETIVSTPQATIDIGTEDRPIQTDAEARITFVHHEDISEKDIDPERISKGLIALGQLEIQGAEKTAWDELATAPESGDTSIELASEPTGWQAGDDIVVPGLEPAPTNEDEERTIERVSGSTVTLDESLEYDHVPPENNLDVELTAYALNLSRNVVLESEIQETDMTNEENVNRQPHMLVMQPAQTLEYFRLIHMGRTNKRYSFTNHFFGDEPSIAVPDEPNPLARYALHFHMTGLGEDPHQVTGAVAQNAPGWGIVNHYSHASVEDSITYQVFGAGFVAGSGPERGSFERCFALRSRGSPKRGSLPTREGYQDFGHEGHGFWFQGPGVAIDDCVAAGHAGYAYGIWGAPLYNHPQFGDSHPGYTNNYPAELAIEDGIAPGGAEPEGEFHSQQLPLRSFSNNVAFASGGGLDYGDFDGYHGGRSAYDQFSLVDTFTVYNIGSFVNENGDSLYPMDDGNTWGEGGKCAISQRYADGLRVHNPQFCNNGVGGGHGIRRNFYPLSGATTGGIIEGFDTGIHTIDDSGPELVRDVAFIDNDTDVFVTRTSEVGGQQVEMESLDFGSGGINLAYSIQNTIVQSLLDDDATHHLDGRRVYYPIQDPDFVPFNSADDVRSLSDPGDAIGNNSRWFNIPMEEIEEQVPGMTMAEIESEYGVTIFGAVTPDDAVDVPILNGQLDPIGWLPERPGPGEEVTLDGDIYQDGASYEWDLDDGTTATGPTVTHTFEETGLYQVELTVEMPDGETVTNTEGIAVVSEESEDGSVVSPSTIYPAETVVLNGAAYDDIPAVDGYEWNIDRGPTLEGAIVTHSFAEGGNYGVELTATGYDGETYTRTETITVEPWYSPAEPGPVSNGINFDVSDLRNQSEPSGVTDQIDLEAVNNDPYYEDITYEGYLYVPATDTYEFTLEANNSAQLYVHDDHIVSADTGSGSSRVAMEAGLQPVRVEYTEYDAEQTLRVDLDGPGMSGEIPADHLYVQDEDGEVIQPAPTAQFSFSPSQPSAGESVVFDASNSVAPEGSITDYEWEFDNGATATGQTVSHTYDTAEHYDVTLTITSDAGETTETTRTLPMAGATDSQSAYDRDSPWPVPGRVQAEDYDTGGAGTSFADQSVGNIGGDYRDGQVDIQASDGGGYNVGWMAADEWVEYTVDVGSAGIYDVRLRVATRHSGTAISVEIDGEDRGTVTVPQTGGWQSYTNAVLAGVDLDAGEQVVRLSVAETNGNEYAYNLDWFEIGESSYESIPGAIDEDDDDIIETDEILDALEYWQHGEAVPGTGGEIVDTESILNLIEMWENDTDIGERS